MKLEDLKSASTQKIGYGNCPFRGLPHFALDSRCPGTVPVVETEVSDRKVANPDPADNYALLVPVVREDSPCAHCLGNRTREREAGEYVSTQTAEYQPARRGARRKRGR